MNVEKLRRLFEASKDKYGDARRMGTTYMNIINIINGSDPRVSTIEKIARYYGVPVGYFFDEAEADDSQEMEIERLKGYVKGMERALDRLSYNLQGYIYDDN